MEKIYYPARGLTKYLPLARRERLQEGFEEQTGFKVDKKGAQLSQNIPNPATNETIIPYLIPIEQEESNSIEAYIVIDNIMTGIEVMRIPLIDVGYSNVGINLDKFTSGVYSYTLVVNGLKADIKKMVIIK